MSRGSSAALRLPLLLVAHPSLTDPNFSRSVVLLISHDRDGARGFVLNKPVSGTLRDNSFQSRYRLPAHIPLWMGGPLHPNNGVVLHNQGGDLSANHSFDNLRISASEEAIEGLILQAEKDWLEPDPKTRGLLPYRFLMGEAQWGPKQLDGELKGGYWVQREMSEKLIFETPWQEIWTTAFEDLGIHPLDIKPNVQNYLN